MTVKDVADKLQLKVLSCNNSLQRQVKGIYCCDLLSWVLSHASVDSAWITVQVHPNIIAVAQLLGLSCIIIPEEIDVGEVTLQKSEQEKIPVLQSSCSAYELCAALGSMNL